MAHSSTKHWARSYFFKVSVNPYQCPPQHFGSVAYFGNMNFSFLEKKILTDNSKKMSICELRTARNKFSIKNFRLF